MKLVYSNQQLFLVTNVKNILDAEGIKSQISNEYIAGAAGDISPFDAWPELWVNEEDFDAASKVVEEMKTSQQSDWRCNHCNEENASSFELCWNCNEPGGE